MTWAQFAGLGPAPVVQPAVPVLDSALLVRVLKLLAPKVAK
jgi:hypothetical protein